MGYKNKLDFESQNVEKMREIIDHLTKVGWEVNHKYLEKEIKKHPEYDNNEQNFLARLMWGRLYDEYHLISNCKKYVAKITGTRITIWRMIPKWKELISIKLNDVKLIENGIKNDICKIILDNKVNNKEKNEWSSLELYEGKYGWQSKKPINYEN